MHVSKGGVDVCVCARFTIMPSNEFKVGWGAVWWGAREVEARGAAENENLLTLKFGFKFFSQLMATA